MKIIVGIDPGAKGAAAFFHGQTLTHIIPFQYKKIDWRKELYFFCATLKPDYALVEEVHSMPWDGKKSAFSFGRRRGEVETVLHLAACPVQLIQPQKWQAQLGLLRKSKEDHKALALKLFPRLVDVKGDIFDGVLIGYAAITTN